MFDQVVLQAVPSALNGTMLQSQWSWGVPALDSYLITLLLINGLLGFLIGFVLKKFMKVGLALIAIIVILSLFAGAQGASLGYGESVAQVLPTVASYAGYLYVLATLQMPWSLIAMGVGAGMSIFGVVTPTVTRHKV